MMLIELTAAVDGAGTLKTFYVSDSRFATGPNDTPANIAFEPCVIGAGSLGIHAFGDGRTGGATKLEAGEIVLANIDGQLDDWLNYSFDGRPVVIRTGNGGAYPGAYSTLLLATAEGIDAASGEIILRIRDKQYLLDRPVRTSLYGGTNVMPDGVDGLPSDLKGKARPAAYGRVFNVSPPHVNTSRLIFEVGPCNSIDAVYSNGAALTAGAAYTSLADMTTNAPSAGGYRAWPAGGYFRLGSFSAEQITADVTQGATGSDRTVAQVVKAIAREAGLSSAEVSAVDAAALDLIAAAEVGIWIDDSTTSFASALDQVIVGVGGWYGFDQEGVLRMGRLAAPAGTPVLTLHEYDVLDTPERRAPTDNGTPIWSATVNHSKCWTVQTSGLAGSAAGRAGFVGRERRSSNSTDASIKNQWLLAGKIEVDTLLNSTVDGDAEAARLLELHKVRRDVFDVPVNIGVLAETPLRIADVVEVHYGRFGMGGGRLFRVIGIFFNLADQSAKLSIWG